MGIGRPQYGEPVESYVLSPCYPVEAEVYAIMVERTADAVEAVLLTDLNQAMSLFHGPAPSTENHPVP